MLNSRQSLHTSKKLRDKKTYWERKWTNLPSGENTFKTQATWFSLERLGESELLGLVPGKGPLWAFWGRGGLLPASGYSWMTPEHTAGDVDWGTGSLYKKHLHFLLLQICFSFMWREDKGEGKFSKLITLIVCGFCWFLFSWDPFMLYKAQAIFTLVTNPASALKWWIYSWAPPCLAWIYVFKVSLL